MTRSKHDRWLSLLFHLILIVFVLIAIFPVWFILQAALQPGQALYSTELSLWPAEATFDNFRYMFTEELLLEWLGNSLKIAGLTTVTAVIISTSAAYAFSRWRFVGRNTMLVLLLAIQAFPSLLSLVAIYQILRGLQLINNHLSLVLVYTASALVFTTWNMKGYFDTIPTDLEEAALIDGATPVQAFLKVILPLAKPGLVVTALFAFLSGWNEFAMANVLLTGEKMWTLPVGLFSLQRDYRIPWGYFAAGALVNAIPVMLLFLFLQRNLVSGLTTGGMKG
jgi:arabinogalactan oligomer/maltooligosaccharide transport system permease protein